MVCHGTHPARALGAPIASFLDVPEKYSEKDHHAKRNQ